MWLNLWIMVLFGGFVASTSSEYLMGGHMDNNESPKSLLDEIESSPSQARTANLDNLDLDLDAEESTAVLSTLNNEEGPRYRPSYSFAFNGGRPFSLEKDPITGKIDFEKAPPVKALNYSDRYDENEDDDEDLDDKTSEKESTSFLSKKKFNNENVDVTPNEINLYSPSLHDFLNLPVQYSSDKYAKDKYPLISSSYANTKVQSGSNSYSTYNHKPYHGETVLYYPTKKPYVPKISTSAAPTTDINMKSSTPQHSTTSSSPPSTSPTTTTMKMTTTTMSTTTTTTTPSTTTTTTTTTTIAPPTVSTTTKSPAVTTWKPSTTSMKHYMDHEDDYEDILPIEKFQASMFSGNKPTPNNIVANKPDSELRPPIKADDYADSYEDYELNDEPAKDYFPMNEQMQETFKTSTTSMMLISNVSNAATPNTRVEATTMMATSTTTSPSTTVHTSPVHQENVYLGNPLQYPMSHQRPVTSMPLDVIPREPSAFENVIDNRRPGMLNSVSFNPGYRPNQIINQRPNGVGGGVFIESTSNIVVPPDQDTVSFVLGNRQNVEGEYYTLGTAIGENPYGSSTGIDPSFRPLYGIATGTNDKGNYEPDTDRRESIALPSVAIENNPHYPPQNWWPPSSTSTQKVANEVEPSKTQNSYAKGTVILEQENERKEEKDSNYVVFPNSEDNKHPVEEHIVIVNEADGSIHEIPPSTTTTKPRVESPSGNNEGLPQLSENLTPPTERPRPPPPQPPMPPQFYYHYHHGTLRPDYPRPQRLPLPPRGKQPSSSPPLSPQAEPLGVRRRPYTPDSSLPNILPQFRPNAKTSHGHRGAETIGTIPAGQHYSTRIRQPLQSHPPPRRALPPPPLSYLQRLNPPPPPVHALRLAPAASSNVENVIPPREPDSTVKRFRLPSVSANSRVDDNKSASTNRLSSQKLRLEEDERSERYSEEPPQMPPRPPLFPKRRTADPPHVATLQMIQQHGEFEEQTSQEEESNGVVTETESGQEAKRIKSDSSETVAEAPVYVVYPVNSAVNIHPDDSGEKDDSVVVGTRGPQRPLPPETLLHNSEEHDIDDESSPTSNLFNNRPIVSDFPYPLERPDPSILVGGVRETPLLIPSDQRRDDSPLINRDNNEKKDEKDTSVNVIPYLQDFVPFPARRNDVISTTLHRLPNPPTSTPIAYVYTPTAQASHDIHIDDKDEDISKIDRIDQKPVLLPSQQPSSSSSSAPSPQSFMAPFVASVNAESSSKNGWNVVMVEPSISKKSDDDREVSEQDSNTEETQTEKHEFNPDNFKPQLFGGFKPIFEFPTEDLDRPERRDGDATSDVSVRLPESVNSTV